MRQEESVERNPIKPMLGAGTEWQPLARDMHGHPHEQLLMGRRVGALFIFSCPDLQGALRAVFLEPRSHSWYPTELRLRAGGFEISGISLTPS